MSHADPEGPRLTGADESFRHQLVAPAAVTEHVSPNWAERCYHLLHVGESVVLHTGRALHPHLGERAGFAGITTGETQHAVRFRERIEADADPDEPAIGPLRIEAVRPLREVRLTLADPDLPFSFDLTYEGRFDPVATTPNLIERDGVPVTHYMNFFQSGAYSGVVRVDGAEHRLEGRTGFRDRGWGMRKHEGAPRRGLVVACFCELPDAAVYSILYETASGRRAFTNGWWITDGAVEGIEGVDHDLRFDGTLLTGGSLELELASGATRTLAFDVTGRLYLATAGYSEDPAHSGPGTERHDVTDPAVVAALDGQNDNACAFTLDDGSRGHGYVETGLGEHVLYRPAG